MSPEVEQRLLTLLDKEQRRGGASASVSAWSTPTSTPRSFVSASDAARIRRAAETVGAFEDARRSSPSPSPPPSMSAEVGERLVDLLELEVAAREGAATPTSPARRERPALRARVPRDGGAIGGREPEEPGASAAAAARRAEILASTRAAARAAEAVERCARVGRAPAERLRRVDAASRASAVGVGGGGEAVAEVVAAADRVLRSRGGPRAGTGVGSRDRDAAARARGQGERATRRRAGRVRVRARVRARVRRRRVRDARRGGRRAARDRRRRREERDREKGVEGFRAVGNAWRGVGRFLAGRR